MRMRVSIILLMATCLLSVDFSFADNFDSFTSPFTWAVLIQNSEAGKDSSMDYKDSLLNVLQQTGVKNKNLETDCRFQLTKGLDPAPKDRPKYYFERLWMTCSVKGVSVSGSATGCSTNGEFDSDGKSQLFEIDGSRLSITTHCSTKEK